MPEAVALRILAEHPAWRITARRLRLVARVREDLRQRTDLGAEAPASESVPDEVVG